MSDKMVYNLSYRRPAYVGGYTSTEATDSDKEYQSESSSRTNLAGGIPDALSFEKIIGGGTCPPCTTRDFMNYLLHVERAAENLQFFLWHRDYTKRFNEASKVETQLSPEWTQAQQNAALQEAQAQASAKKKMNRKSAKEAAEILEGTDFADEPKLPSTEKRGDPFGTPPGTADVGSQKARDNPWDSMGSPKAASTHAPSNTDTYRQKATEAFQTSGLKKPFTIQPFREEVERVISTYISEDSPRELNLSSRQRYAVMRALEYTTHPSAFAAVHKTIEESLRNQAHPNFIRWAICNGNRARWLFARGLGISVIIFGIVAVILITLSSVPRAWRVLPIILHIVGLATLIAGWKGMCVVLHGMHHRHLRPWELFGDSEEEYKGRDSMDSFGSGSGYSYEDEPWVIKYDKRNIVRKIFDKEVWIEEPALRQIQDTIFIQSMLCAILYGGVLTAIFVAVPGGHLY